MTYGNIIDVLYFYKPVMCPKHRDNIKFCIHVIYVLLIQVNL